MPDVGLMVNRTALPFGRNSGQTWAYSPRSRLGVVSTTGSPPSADTRCRPIPGAFVAKMMVPSDPHVAPLGWPRPDLHTITGGPPVIGTLLIVARPSKKPTDWPSGEMKGPCGAPSPLSAVGSSLLDLVRAEAGADDQCQVGCAGLYGRTAASQRRGGYRQDDRF